mmetsp:Transcript_26075/g.43490  ORF Transcript_26075/g.43490 Transcript_26075/m.43490 type:complete len:126 (+) Transcript_26075:178-555(+)
MLPGFRQNEGQYGYQRRMWHDAMIGINPKGGMNSEMWVDYYLNNIMPLFPEAQDVPGKRVLIKTDSGPGRAMTKRFLLVLEHLASYTMLGFRMLQQWVESATKCSVISSRSLLATWTLCIGLARY